MNKRALLASLKFPTLLACAEEVNE